MPKPRKPSTKTETKTSKLLEAVKFCGMANKEIGPINETHLILSGEWAAASNGVITIASKTNGYYSCCPQTKLLTEALSKCGEEFEFKQDKEISIRAGKFRAVIPCIDSHLISIPSPDPPTANITDALKIGIETVGILANENAQTIVAASILLHGKSVIATDRKVVIEFWHGIDLPTGISLPKYIIKPLAQSGKKLDKLGFSATSVTFYFDDESWIKTALYAEKWPDIDGLLNRPSRQAPFPPDFWEALAAVAPFSENGLVFFGPGLLQSHREAIKGATYEVPGLIEGPSFSISQLMIIKPYVKTVDFSTPNTMGNMLTFSGENVRGAIAGRE